MSVSKNKRNNTWEVSYYYVDYMGNRVRKRKSGFATQKAAKEYEARMLLEKEQAIELKVADFVDLYLMRSKHEVKPSTLDQRRRVCSNYIVPYLGKRKMSEITALDIKEVQIALRNKGLKYTTLLSAHGQMVALFNFAIKYYDLKKNPASICGGPKDFGEEKTLRFWTLEEFNKAMDVAAKGRYNPQIVMIIKLLYWSGLRIGECLALTKEDSINSQMAISVNKSLYDGKIRSTKTVKSFRKVSIYQRQFGMSLQSIFCTSILMGRRIDYLRLINLM